MRFFRDALLTLLATCAVILALEGGLRLAGAHFESSLYQQETERGYSLRPNSEGWEVEEGERYIKINSDGLRDKERPMECPPHTLRVAAIGSSEAEARQVKLEDTFESVLSQDLTKALSPRGWQADVLNFGVPGYTYSQIYLTLHNHVWKYKPQVVMLIFGSWPVLKTVRNLYPEELKGAPVYELRDGKLTPDEITLHTPQLAPAVQARRNRTADWMNRSALLSLLNAARVKAQQLIPAWKAKYRPTAAPAAKPAGPPIGAVRMYNTELAETHEAWARSDAFLKLMRDDCAQHGAEFWIVVIDQEMQVNPNLAEREAFRRNLGVPALDEVDERMKRFGAEEHIPVITLAKPLSDYAIAHGAYLHGPLTSPDHSGHWNELGHEQVGHVLARELLAHSQAVAETNAALTPAK